MDAQIHGSPSFARLEAVLDPGEVVYSQTGSMVSMEAGITLNPKLNGSLFSAIGKSFFGGESFLLNRIENKSSTPRAVVLSPDTPGDVMAIPMANKSIYVQPGAFLAATDDIQINLGWAGFRSLIAGEGLFRLKLCSHSLSRQKSNRNASGRKTSTSTVAWINAYGAMIVQPVAGEHIVDSRHLVAYESSLRMRLRLAGGLFSSVFGGEGVVTRMQGQGKIIIQTRSLKGLRDWVKPYLW